MKWEDVGKKKRLCLQWTPTGGLEPPTTGLKGQRSTDWARQAHFSNNQQTLSAFINWASFDYIFHAVEQHKCPTFHQYYIIYSLVNLTYSFTYWVSFHAEQYNSNVPLSSIKGIMSFKFVKALHNVSSQ